MSQHDNDEANSKIIESLTRRGFFRLNAALLAVAGTTSCSWRGERIDTRDALHLLRAEDLLSLRVEFTNLFIQHRYLRSSRLARERTGQPAIITFVLPGQHIAEQTFRDPGDDSLAASPQLPVAAYLSEPTKLTFEWPASLQHIDLTMDQLLAWDNWRFLPKRSTISIPAGIKLEMHAADREQDMLTRIRWAAARQPVIVDGRSELWHLRLMQDTSSTAGRPVVIRMAAPESCGTAKTPQPQTFELTPNEQERCAVDGKTAHLRSLLLSPMGGWLDLDGKWDTGAVRRWTHRAAAGQDQRVLVEGGDGFLFPFGHPASVITVTERKLMPARGRDKQPKRAALLQKRSFITIKQPTLEYPEGDAVFQQLTVRQKVTPPLSGLNGIDPTSEPFWIEASGQAFEFHFAAKDWAGHESQFSAAAVFVLNKPEQIAAADEMYRDPSKSNNAESDLAGQAVVVAPYESAASADKIRSEGDTLLHLLRIKHSARLVSDNLSTKRSRLFYWQTSTLQARIPSLTHSLSPDINIGWFDLLRPSENIGELFAIASENESRIPMSFSKRADRSGGVIAPSIEVQGISRAFGPVSDAKGVRETGQFSSDNYFSDDAKILGGFNLTKVESKKKSKLVPQFFFTISQKEIAGKKKWYEQTEEERNAPKKYKTTIESGFKWEFPLPFFSIPITFIRLEAQKSPAGKSLSKIEIRTALKRSFQPSDEESGEPENSAAAKSEGSTNDQKDQQPLADWSAKGSLTNFNLTLKANEDSSLIFLFDELSLTIGPPKEGSDYKDGAATSKSISCVLDDIQGTGGFRLVAPFLKLLVGLPIKAEYSHVNGTVVPYPASVPSVTDADAYISIGPIALPDITFATFSITDISASFGLGFYFFGRENRDKELVVPSNRMMLALGTSDKPLTVMAAPWGGASHLAMSFDFGNGLSGFQFGLGVVFGGIFDVKIGKAKCVGVLSIVFTYINTDKVPEDYSLALVLRIEGKAHILGWIDLTLRITASGTYGTSGIVFQLRITLQVKIAFFTAEFALELRHEIPTENTDRLNSAADSFDMNKAQWLQYQSAFAGAGA